MILTGETSDFFQVLDQDTITQIPKAGMSAEDEKVIRSLPVLSMTATGPAEMQTPMQLMGPPAELSNPPATRPDAITEAAPYSQPALEPIPVPTTQNLSTELELTVPTQLSPSPRKNYQDVGGPAWRWTGKPSVTAPEAEPTSKGILTQEGLIPEAEYEAFQNDLRMFRARREAVRQEMAGIRADIAQMEKEIPTGKIEAFSDKSLGDRVAMGLFIGLAGALQEIGAGIAQQPLGKGIQNTIQTVMSLAKQDVMRQKEQIDRQRGKIAGKQNLYGMMRNLMNDDSLAAEATLNFMQKDMLFKLKNIAAKTEDVTIRTKLGLLVDQAEQNVRMNDAKIYDAAQQRAFQREALDIQRARVGLEKMKVGALLNKELEKQKVGREVPRPIADEMGNMRSLKSLSLKLLNEHSRTWDPTGATKHAPYIETKAKTYEAERIGLGKDITKSVDGARPSDLDFEKTLERLPAGTESGHSAKEKMRVFVASALIKQANKIIGYSQAGFNMSSYIIDFYNTTGMLPEQINENTANQIAESMVYQKLPETAAGVAGVKNY